MAGARGAWNSRFGFIMAAVGSAVGLGNLVRFPRELASNGGAAFLFIYLILLVLVGLPAILGEMSIGKMAQMSPINAYRKLGEERGKRWALLGVAGMLAATFVLFYYTVVAGWTLNFFTATFYDGWWDDPTGYHAAKAAYTPAAIFWNLLVVGITVFIIAKGVSGGIEKTVVVIMPALFAIVVGIVVYALFQDGMGAGYSAVFDPDFSELNPAAISGAVGQVFFSLSLGQGAMLTYASYMEKKQSVSQDGTITAFADTGMAVLAAMMIFPVLAFTGLLTSTDPVIQDAVGGSFGTAFVAMPSAFVSMGDVAGRLIGGVFFLGLFFAALSSAISLLEVPVSIMVDRYDVPRWKSAVVLGLIVYSFGVLSSINEHWLFLYDEIAVNVFIILGVALTTLFAGWVAKGVAKELDTGLKSRIGIYVVWMMRTVTPLAIVFVFVFGGLWGTDASGALEFWADGDGGGSASAARFNELWHRIQLAFGVA